MMPPDGIDARDGDDDDLIAAEFVLGVLAQEERRRAEARIGEDPAFAARVRAWEERLSPMADAVPPVAPPAGMFADIEERLFEPPIRAAPSGLWGSIGFWRGLAFASIAALVVVAGAFVFHQVRPQPVEQPLVAALDAKGSDVKVIAYYDGAKHRLVIRPVEGAPASDRDFELWFIEPNKAPVSLGVLPKGRQVADIAVRPALAARLTGGTTLAISVEPLGGSPTGQPTGPVVAAGALRTI